MQKIVTLTASFGFLLLLASCGESKKDSKAELGDKKAKLEKLKKEQQDLNAQVISLQEEVSKLDPTASSQKPKLVALTTIGTDSFTHFIDLQGKIDARNVAYVAPRGQGGQVRAIYVRQGDNVRKGQVILKLDDAVQRQGLISAQQQISGIKAQLSQAQSIYERQQNLWKQNIGTEIQVLNAKTNVEGLQSQLNAAQSGVQQAQEQVNQGNVVAEISGTIDQMNVKVGEFFSPQSAAAPGSGITIVNTGDLHVLVQVPENYLDRVQVGRDLQVTLPEANNKIINTKVSVAGKLIDPTTRSFYVEGKLPADKALRPNQVALVRIQDYFAPNAITIPVNIIQNDEKGKYIMIVATENGKKVAKKRQVVIGELYGNNLEVKSGLQTGDVIITDGFQNLYEGQPITTDSK